MRKQDKKTSACHSGLHPNWQVIIKDRINMIRYARTIRSVLTLAGTIDIALGLVHFLMPGLIYKSEGFHQLSSVETDMVTLSTVSVGVLLIAIGVISILCAVKYELSKELSRSVTLVLTILWLIRIIFELAFPVRIPLLYIASPTQVILPGLIVLWMVYAFTTFLMLKDRPR